jgi:hypothetical protein
MLPTSPVPARVLSAVTLAMYVAALVLGVVSLSHHVAHEGNDFVFTSLFGLGLLAIAVVGLLVALRRPGHPVAWVLLGGAASMMVPMLGGQYAVYVLFVHPGLPGGTVGAWSTEWFLTPAVLVTPALLLLLFPDGRTAGPRWRAAVWLSAVGVSLYVVGNLLHPGVIEGIPFKGVANPFGVRALTRLTRAMVDVSLLVLTLSVILGAASLIRRLRRSTGVEHAQLKWVAAASGAFALACVVGAAVVVTTGSLAGAGVIVVTFFLIPLTAGVVILRHRLYDVDVVIRRTLIYTTVTATLLATYVVLVLGLGVVLRPLTGGSDLVVAVSTLAVAGLFGPVRTRVQALVDRRFYRDRYDAARTLEQLESRLRVEPDLDAVGGELIEAVARSVRPSHLSLWLRER